MNWTCGNGLIMYLFHRIFPEVNFEVTRSDFFNNNSNNYLVKTSIEKMLGDIGFPYCTDESIAKLKNLVGNIQAGMCFYNQETGDLYFRDEINIDLKKPTFIELSLVDFIEDVEKLVLEGKSVNYLPFSIQKTLTRIYNFSVKILSQITFKDTGKLALEEESNRGLILLRGCVFYNKSGKVRALSEGSNISDDLDELLKDNGIDINNSLPDCSVVFKDGNSEDKKIRVGYLRDYFKYNFAYFPPPSEVLPVVYDIYDIFERPKNLCYAFNYNKAPSLFAFTNTPWLQKEELEVLYVEIET